MKTTPFLLPLAALSVAGFVSLCAADNPPPAPVDPATGLAAHRPPGAPPMDPAIAARMHIHDLISRGDYDEALKECLAYQGLLKGDQTLEPLVADWVELGRRFPAARDALLKIRDHDVSEFAAGRGYAVLFSEVKAINAALNQDDATEELFKSVASQDRKLAEQCYGAVQDMLVQKREYNLCLDFTGDPRARFESLRQNFAFTVSMQEQQNEMRRFNEEQFKRFNRPIPPSFRPFDQGAAATNTFVTQVIMLEKILAGAGRQADAEIVCDQALAVVADDRFRSALAAAAPKPAP